MEEGRTLEDLANLTGVSRSTVSRVLNGGSVKAETRERVMAALQRTNYRPNLAARRLAQGRTGVLGLVFHVDAADLFGDPYFSMLLKGITDASVDHASGVMLWLKTSSPEETLEQVLSVGLIDGVLVTANFRDDPVVDGLLSSNLPTVLVGSGGHSEHANTVDIDHIASARQVVNYLIDLDLERIGIITGPLESMAGFDRLEGYRQAFAYAGREVDEDLVAIGNFNYPSGRVAANQLLDTGVDAIFACNDEMARGALEVITERGLRVPEDVALAGFDDLDYAGRLDPPLTTVRQPVRRMGQIATRTLLDLIDDPEGGQRRVVLPSELIVRHSTEGRLNE